MKFKGLLLDLDGTLVDSKKDLALSVNATLKQLGLSELPLDEIYNYVGDGLAMLLQRSLKSVLGEDPSRLLDPAVSMFKSYYEKHLLDETTAYPGVIETLKDLDILRLGIITNKNHNFSSAILKGLKMDHFFKFLIGGDDVLHKKPHSEPFKKALTYMNLEANELLMVGDNYTDIDGAHNMGIKSCFAEFGFGKLKEIKADYSISNFSELKDIVL